MPVDHTAQLTTVHIKTERRLMSESATSNTMLLAVLAPATGTEALRSGLVLSPPPLSLPWVRGAEGACRVPSPTRKGGGD